MVRAMLRRAFPFVAVVACGGRGSEPADAPGGNIDAPPDAIDAAVDAGPCPTLDACSWLEPYQREIVGKLAGAQEIAPGTTLTARASRTERGVTRDFLFDELGRLGYTPTRHEYASSGANVIATLAPTGGNPGAGAIVIGAHFDGVPAGPAAADNATGVALALVAARWLPTLTDRRHPIVIALFDEEEIGLVGSRAWAGKLVADATPITAVQVFDMISWDADGDHAVELWSPSPVLEQDYRVAGEPQGFPIQPVHFEYSDHQAFVERGFTAVGVSEEYVGGDHTPHYHRSTDTYDKVDFAHLGRVTRLALEVVGGELGAN